MIELSTIAQAIAVLSACWAIISGIGAWKREFIGKRKIELAEQTLAKFFEVRDAIAFIRNPFSSTSEGSSRQRGEHETPEEAQILNRGYIVVERYGKKESAFAEFSTLKYRFMASFGAETEDIFAETNRVVNTIFVSAQMLATHYWQRQGRVEMKPEEGKEHLAEMHRHEKNFWEIGADDDEIKKKLEIVLAKLETTVQPCFKEPSSAYAIFTKRWFGG